MGRAGSCQAAPCRPSSQTSGNTDHSDSRITMCGTDGTPVITEALCKYERNLCLSLGDKLIFVLIIREGTETQKGYMICSTQQKWTAEQGRWWLTDSCWFSSTVPVLSPLLILPDFNALILAAMGRKCNTQSGDWAFILVTSPSSIVITNSSCWKAKAFDKMLHISERISGF